MKDSDEGAEPCASAIAASNLQRLASLQFTKKSDGVAAADQVTKLFAAFGERMTSNPTAVPQLICSLYHSQLPPPAQVIVVLHPDDLEKGNELLRAVHAVPNPHKVVIPVHPGMIMQVAYSDFFFQNLINSFFGYFDPINIFFWIKHK